MESQLLGAAREIPSLTVASLQGEIRREVRAPPHGKKVREQTGMDESPLLPGAPCGAGGGEASIVSSGGNRQRGKPTAAASTHPDCSSTVGNVWLTLVSYPF